MNRHFLKRLKLKKLTTLDWIIIASSLVAILVFGVVFFRKAEYKVITVKVGEEDVIYLRSGSQKWFANQFTVGMKELNGLGMTEAEILRIVSYDAKTNYKLDPINYRKNVYLTVKIKVVYNRSSGQYIFKGKPAVIGSTIRMYLGPILTDGLITGIEGIEDTRIKKKVTAEAQIFSDSVSYPLTSGVFNHIADSITEGTEVTDDQGVLRAKILTVRKEDAKQLVPTSDGRMIQTTNPMKKDVTMTLEIYGFEQNGALYMFDDIPILIDEVVPLHLKTIDLYPTITKIFNIQ